MGKEINYSDTNVWIAAGNFKAKEENPDCKINYGTSMFGKNKAFLIYRRNIKETING